jgi:4-amino-4-deoxy-L-arabinose transferase-like glycosyltransferase
MTPRRALWLLIIAATGLRLLWAATLGAGNDEAYYYLFTEHPDWSYLDHPPMVAWVEAVGLALAGGPSVLGLRLGFVLLFAGSTWLLARWTARYFGAWAGVAAALLLNAAGYFGLAAGAFALPDGPLVFFWILTLERLGAALVSLKARRGALGPWMLVGLAWGGALLSKYHALLLPIGTAVFLAFEPRARPWLRRPGPYLALAVGLLLFAPVLGWNAAHGWASFAFQGGRAVQGGWVPRPDRLAMAVLGQASYAFPWVWLILMAVLAGGVRAWRSGRAGLAERFLLIQALAPLAAFAVVGSFRPLLPHWSLVGLLPLMPLAARRVVERAPGAPRRARLRLAVWMAGPLVAAVLILLHAHGGLAQRGGNGTLGLIAAEHDPTIDSYGWRRVADELRRRGLVGRPGTFLFTSKWYHSGQIALALGGRAPVLCYNSGRAAAGFALWGHSEPWVGRDGVLVTIGPSTTEPQAYDRWFARIEPLGSFTVERAGAPVRTVALYLCTRQTQPFPVGGPRPPKKAVPTPDTPRLASSATATRR